ncbi:hypothetical protein D3C81_2115530 [compost metagenome]
MRRRFFVDVDITGHEIEIVADTVQQNAQEQHAVGPDVGGAAVNKEYIADCCGHKAQQQHLFDAITLEQQR